MIVTKQQGQLNGFNKFLERIYGKPITLSELLFQSGLTIEEIRFIRNNCLSDYIQTVVENLIAERTLSYTENRRRDVVVHYHGLLTGREKSLEDIGKIYYVTSNRIRQLLGSRERDFYKPEWQQNFEESLYKIAKQYL